MNIEQVVIDFDPLQDRLLLTVHLANARSIRAWLTRRFVRLMRQALGDILGAEIKAKQPLATGSGKLLAELMHEKSIAGMDFSQSPIPRHRSADDATDEAPPPTTDDATAHLPTPWLAHGIQTTWEHKDTPQQRASALTLLPKEGEGLTFQLDDSFPHALIHLLSQACGSADWDIDFGALGNTQEPHLQYTTATLH